MRTIMTDQRQRRRRQSDDDEHDYWWCQNNGSSSTFLVGPYPAANTPVLPKHGEIVPVASVLFTVPTCTTRRALVSSSQLPSSFRMVDAAVLSRRVPVSSRPLPLMLMLLVLLSSVLSMSEAALSCTSDEHCQDLLQRDGSYCIDGTCSNPFVKGCLTTLLPENKKYGWRICNSDDDHDDKLDCRPAFDGIGSLVYPELRIHNGDWESSIFHAWILQIILMEILEVPATVGLTTSTTAASSFYTPTNTLEYSTASYPFDALLKISSSSTRGDKDDKEPDAAATTTTSMSFDCRSAVDQDGNEVPCVHVLPEVWNGQEHEWTRAVQQGRAEPVEGNGGVGKGSWFLPAFTAQEDDTLVSFYGLSGETNRHKLASTFGRPTTWGEYCQEVSQSRCQEGVVEDGDDVATRPPQTPEEQVMYFNPDHFQGHFRFDLPASNCTASPTHCTGHIVGPPCTWSTNVDAQLYWNDVKLVPDGPVQPNGGYEYTSMVEIWKAANATRSNVVMWWWQPDSLTEEFRNTEAHFQQVLLPDATESCSRNRVDTEARCSFDIAERRGSPEGACDQEYHALQKVLSAEVRAHTLREPLATRSPGYDFIKALKITDLELNTILRRWVDRNVDPYGNDAREAVCSWVVENLDHLLEFVPDTYPRTIDTCNFFDQSYLYAALAVAVLAAIAVLAVAVFAFWFRHKRVFVYAQAHITFAILFGFLLITFGAMLLTFEPSHELCIAQIWMINLGYSVHLLPLLVKIAAINKIVASAKKMVRITIRPRDMFLNVGKILVPVIAYLIVWTTVDPCGVQESLVLEGPTSPTVQEYVFCSSQSSYWAFIALGWQALLLVMTSVLAFQSRGTIEEFNESRSLGTMIYSHFLFMIMRLVVTVLGDRGVLRIDVTAAARSFLLSFDTMAALVIYLVPKCIKAKSKDDHRRGFLGGVSSSAAINKIEAQAALAAARASFLVQRTNTINASDPPSQFFRARSNNIVGDYVTNESGGSPVCHCRSQKLPDIKEGSKVSLSVSIPLENDESIQSAIRMQMSSSAVLSTASCAEEQVTAEKRIEDDETVAFEGSRSSENSFLDRHNPNADSETREEHCSSSSSIDDVDIGGPRFTVGQVNRSLEEPIRFGFMPPLPKALRTRHKSS